MTEREIVEHPGPFPYGKMRYYQAYCTDWVDVRYYLPPNNMRLPVRMWYGSDVCPMHRNFGSVADFRRFVEEMNAALGELDKMIEEGIITEK